MREGQSVLPYALCLASLCACGNPDPSTFAARVDPPVTSFTIGASGGMVVSGDGTSVSIPPVSYTHLREERVQDLH